eukprot:TRINITY_DN47427_c0_g1_i1.p1 TRINITY_DN47427_c0_g1~~TRINITY_DN47427_c0_g1_i1.p1  ORF type:complete len:641 (-),score=154.56 TRINITY_DN47427_c0_g1_i1:35-1957(-)
MKLLVALLLLGVPRSALSASLRRAAQSSAVHANFPDFPFWSSGSEAGAPTKLQPAEATAKLVGEVRVEPEVEAQVSEVKNGEHFETEILSDSSYGEIQEASLIIRDADKPKVNFLFMAYDSLPHVEAWEKFFQKGIQGVDFRVFVHCKYEDFCKQNLQGHPLFELIPSVETSYCFGLVSAMNKLLHTALGAGPGHKQDKFTFVSDTSVPVKSFRYVYDHLIGTSESSFCFFPQHWMPWSNKSNGITSWFSEWSVLQIGDGDNLTTQRMALKHHQWMTLSREHAVQAVSKDGMFPSLLAELHVNTGLPGTISGCDDEFWHFNALFGGVNVTTAAVNNAEVFVSGVKNGRLRYDSSDLQGQCDTFVYWQDTTDGLGGPVQLLGKKLEVDYYTRMAHKLRHPVEFSSLGRDSIRALRDSGYLFARKVNAGCSVHGSYHGKELVDLAQALDVMIFQEPDPATEVDDTEQMDTVDDPRTVNPNDLDVPELANPSQQEMNETQSPKDLPREITGDLSIYVDDPELCSNSPVFQAATQRAIASIVGAREKEVQVDVRISKQKTWASYLKLTWGNVDVKFRVLLLGSELEDASQRAHEVRASIRDADLAEATKRLHTAMMAQNRTDDSVSVVSLDFHSIRALPKPNVL